MNRQISLNKSFDPKDFYEVKPHSIARGFNPGYKEQNVNRSNYISEKALFRCIGRIDKP